jgi:hypothetical protein
MPNNLHKTYQQPTKKPKLPQNLLPANKSLQIVYRNMQPTSRTKNVCFIPQTNKVVAGKVFTRQISHTPVVALMNFEWFLTVCTLPAIVGITGRG